MNSPHDEITPERLTDVAVGVMKALEEFGAEHAGRSIYPTDLLGSPEQPRILCEYTRYEVEEAAAFLVRMGFIEPRAKAARE